MKAVLMAGGAGTRLRPITEEMPKPMVRIFDRPVIDHAVGLLAGNGIRDICFTLRYMPETVRGYFEQYPPEGINLSYNIEREPLGTAGGVRACGEFVGNEDVLIMSGDAVCDFDLKACIDFHYRHKADVTIVLYSHPSPLEYGLVITEEDGRVSRFSEKPSWEGVYTDLVNTGIYIISREVIDKIPEGEPYDFGRDLFPRLLEEGARVYGVQADGYWCDIGSVEAYLSCCRDALFGKVRLLKGAPEKAPGVFSLSEIPKDVLIRPPVYIGHNVQIASGAVIGPGAMIMENSDIGPNADISGSVSDGAAIGADARVAGAYLGRGAVIGDRTAAEENCAVGSGTIVGTDCRITQGVKIWPSRKVEPGSLVRENIMGGAPRGSLTFDGQGIMKGRWGADITPEDCLKIGAALAAGFGTAAVSHTGGAAASLAAELISTGVRAAGGKSAQLGRIPASAAAFACSYLSFPVSVTAEQMGGEMKMTFFGKNGRVLGRADERKIEAAISGDRGWVPSEAVGAAAELPGAADAYISSVVRCGRDVFSGAVNMPVHVSGEGDTAELLRRALTMFGCSVVRFPQNVPSFSVSESGEVLSGEDENGRKLSGELLYAALAAAELKSGCRELSVLYDAPAVIEKMGEHHGARILRAGRDGERSVEMLEYQPFMRDGIFEAVRLCAHMCASGEKLSVLADAVPDFAVSSAEVPVNGRGRAMERLVSRYSERSPELFRGMRVAVDGGWVRITPCRDHAALKIRAEAESVEAAEEICVDMKKLIKKLEL